MAPATGLSPGLCGQIACILEATAAKAGNVHRFRDFEDTSYLDFLLSAAAIAPALDRASERGIGAAILEAVESTRRVARGNTNLGIILLLVPLAAVHAESEPRRALARRLAGATLADTELVYQAIRRAAPGGLGEAPEEDVRRPPTRPLQEVMGLAAGRDLIARQYQDNFAAVFDHGLPALARSLAAGHSVEESIILCHLTLLAGFPDTLILRKLGPDEAQRAALQAAEVLAMGWPRAPGSLERFAAFDSWLRAEGNRRNPGATADLTAASLFLAIRDGIIPFPNSFRG